MNQKEEIIKSMSKALDRDIYPGQMNMSYEPDSLTSGRIDFVETLDQEKTKKLCEVFGISQPTEAICITGSLFFKGYQK